MAPIWTFAGVWAVGTAHFLWYRSAACPHRAGEITRRRPRASFAGALAVFSAFLHSTRSPARAIDGEFQIVQIVVRDNNVDQALKALKKKMQREGLFREMKRRNHFEKPSERKAREKAEAVRRARKLARKRAQREGLLPKT
jgi:small subunit ribosomal protein S21